MGHIFALCGPPGAGKTSLLKAIRQTLDMPLRKRLTTREARAEEGDQAKGSPEYEFLKPVEFAERLSRGRIASLIEWNNCYYATQYAELEQSFNTDQDSILLEDVPSAILLKERFPNQVTVVFLFTADRNDLLHKLDFASYEDSTNPHLVEWRERLGLKYDAAVQVKRQPPEGDRDAYIKKKICRAIPDLAFLVGKIREGQDIRVVANRRDALPKAVEEFSDILRAPRTQVPVTSIATTNANLDPGKLTPGQIWRSLTVVQAWQVGVALATLLSGVAGLGYFLGKGHGP